MEDSVINQQDPMIYGLLQELQQSDEVTRDQAITKLWRLWFHQKGMQGFKQLEQSQTLINAAQYDQAEALLTQLIQSWPDFAEAWNRRAILHYLQERYSKSLADCQQAIALNPIHFGAWHGLGLSFMALQEFSAALHAFHHALTIHPYSLSNQKLLLECTLHLS